MSILQKTIWTPHLQLKKLLYGSQKGSKCLPPKEKQKNRKVRKRKVLQNESYQFSLLNPKTLLGAHPNCKTCLIGPKKNQKARKLKKLQYERSVYMSKPPKILWAPPHAQISQIQPKKAQNNPSKQPDRAQIAKNQKIIK